MRKLVLKIMSVLFFVTPLSQISMAYDTDLHFYGTYAMCRWAGINKETCLQIAINAQWPDESKISSPMEEMDGRIKNNWWQPLLGERIRRLIHFPSTDFTTSLNPTEMMHLDLSPETKPNCPMASEMITEGLEQGNFLKASTGLHTLEDSYSHAGFGAMLGHANRGHWPDRPYAHLDKYREMVKTVFQALTAIRSLLPQESLDTDFATPGEVKKNYTLTFEELATSYLTKSGIQTILERYILEDPAYLKYGTQYMAEQYREQDFIRNKMITKEALDSVLKLFSNREPDPYRQGRLLQDVMFEFTKELYNFEESEPGKLFQTDWAIKSAGTDVDALSMNDKIRNFVNNTLVGISPTPLDETVHLSEAEGNGKEYPVWNEEMSLRITDMRNLIYKYFKDNINFYGPNQIKHQPVEPHSLLAMEDGVPEELITKNKSDKAIFNIMIRGFAYPDVVGWAELLRKAYRNQADPSLKHSDHYLLDVLDRIYKFVKGKGYSSDLRLGPKKEDLDYQNPELFAKMVKKPLLTSEQARKLSQLRKNNLSIYARILYFDDDNAPSPFRHPISYTETEEKYYETLKVITDELTLEGDESWYGQLGY